MSIQTSKINEIIIKNKNEIINERNNNHKLWLSKMDKLTECGTTIEFQKYRTLSLLEEAQKFEYNVILSTNDNIIIKRYYNSNPAERFKSLKQKYMKMINNNEYDKLIVEMATRYLFSKYHILSRYLYIYTQLNLSPSEESILLNDDADVDDKFDKSFYQCSDTKKCYTK